MPETKKLFEEFPSITADQWIQQVIKDLKGENFDEKLKYISADEITVNPFYTLEDLTKYNECKPLFQHSDWEVCEEIKVDSEKEANKTALIVLNGGASCLILSVNSSVKLDALLKGIQIEYIAVQFKLKEGAKTFADNLNTYLASKNIDPKGLNLSICFDPLSEVLSCGVWNESIDVAKDSLKAIQSDKNSFRTISVNAALYHNAGSSQGYEIACALAQMNEYLKWLTEKKDITSTFANKLQVNVAVGPDYFFEIAKLRAYRKVVALLFEEYKIDSELYIHAETSFRNLTVFDAHNNLLRSTTEAMAATIGGCNSLSVLPFDAAYAATSEFSSRLARNIQLILKSESYFDKIGDASAGTYFIEELTERIAEKAWNYFMEIEKEGGMLACLGKGIIQDKIAGFASLQQAKFDEGKEVLVGTNKFPNAKEDKSKVADSILSGKETIKGQTIKPLQGIRLSYKNEQTRLTTEKA